MDEVAFEAIVDAVCGTLGLELRFQAAGIVRLSNRRSGMRRWMFGWLLVTAAGLAGAGPYDYTTYDNDREGYSGAGGAPAQAINQERRALQDAARAHPQAPTPMSSQPSRQGGESARERFMRTAREEQLLRQGFLPKGTEVELTPKDQLDERRQEYMERADQRDFDYTRQRDEIMDRAQN